MIDTDFLQQLKRFSLIVNKRVTSNFAGEKRSIAQGRGMLLKDYRKYEKGDDFRSIDWKIFGRTDKLHIKLFEEERNMTVHVIIDYSASMNFGKNIKKAEYASMIGVGYAYLALKDNEKFQFSTFSDTLELFRPKKGMSQLASMVEHLNKKRKNGQSQFKDAMYLYKNILKTKSVVILISDFLMDIDEIREGLSVFRKHDVKVIQVLDREEIDLKVEGDLRLHDSESSQILRMFFSPRMRKTYQHKLSDHTANLQQTCNSMGMNFYQVVTDTEIFDTFFEVLR